MLYPVLKLIGPHRTLPFRLNVFRTMVLCSEQRLHGPLCTNHERHRRGPLLGETLCGMDSLVVQVRYMAGHSKWQNIKHTKEANDMARAQLICRLVRKIKYCIQEHGGQNDPKYNSPLANLISEWQANNLPKDTLVTAMKPPKDPKENGKPFTLELNGPGRCALMVDVITNNLNRTKGEFNYILRRHFAKFAESVRHNFETKGVVRGIPKTDHNLEVAEEHAIEVGAEEVEEAPNGMGKVEFKFLCDIKDFGKVRKNIEELGCYTIGESGLEYIPTQTVKLDDDQLEVMASLCQKLNELPDVIKVYDNIA